MRLIKVPSDALCEEDLHSLRSDISFPLTSPQPRFFLVFSVQQKKTFLYWTVQKFVSGFRSNYFFVSRCAAPCTSVNSDGSETTRCILWVKTTFSAFTLTLTFLQISGIRSRCDIKWKHVPVLLSFDEHRALFLFIQGFSDKIKMHFGEDTKPAAVNVIFILTIIL